MPRGRPRKNPLPEIQENNTPQISSDTLSSSNSEDNALSGIPTLQEASTPPEGAERGEKQNSKSKAHVYAKCGRCGGDIKTAAPYVMNTILLTGLAVYHTDNLPDKAPICVNCAHECCEALEAWYFSGKGVNAIGRFRNTSDMLPNA